jgi:hypothetical protein
LHEHGFERRIVANIRGDRADFRAERAQFLRRDVELGLSSAANGDIGSQRREVLRDAEIDAAAAAGDEHRLATVQIRCETLLDEHDVVSVTPTPRADLRPRRR